MNEKEREARTAKKKMLDQTLGISFCKLMELHPLYDSRVGEEQLPGEPHLFFFLVRNHSGKASKNTCIFGKTGVCLCLGREVGNVSK